MDTLCIHATAENLPAGADIYLYGDKNIIKGECVDCTVSGHPSNCHCFYIEPVGTGTTTIECVAVDSNGNPLKYNDKYIYDSVEIKVTSPSFFDWILSFLLGLFGIKYGSNYNA